MSGESPRDAPAGEKSSTAGDQPNEPFWPVRAASFGVALTSAILMITGGVRIGRAASATRLDTLLLTHGPALIGLPAAALTALCVMGAARGVGGPASIQLIGLRAEGATAAILLWLVVFLAIVFAVRLLW